MKKKTLKLIELTYIKDNNFDKFNRILKMEFQY